jgi:hypothetical protein
MKDDEPTTRPWTEDMAAAIIQLYENGLREEHLLAARLG